MLTAQQFNRERPEILSAVRALQDFVENQEHLLDQEGLGERLLQAVVITTLKMQSLVKPAREATPEEHIENALLCIEVLENFNKE